MKRFEGRVALITGAANGLGEASAHRLAREGAQVVIWDRDTQALAKAQRKAETAGIAFDADTVDMLEQSAIEGAVTRIIEKNGHLSTCWPLHRGYVRFADIFAGSRHSGTDHPQNG